MRAKNFYPRLGGTPHLGMREWRWPGGGKIKFAHLQFDSTVYDWQGAQITLICFDELTHFSKHQFFYMVSRNRSTCGVRPYIRATCNPDADSWVADFLAWWIDPETGLPIPERAGVPGQKGSSAMPHKRNPVLSENLVGLSRMVRAYVTPALENVALWHERDISHSSVERMIGPDATVTLDFALDRLAGVIERLVVYPDNMHRNLARLGNLIHSQRVLLALTQKGVGREAAYAMVQRNAMKAWGGEGDFFAELKKDPEVKKHLSEKELAANFDLDFHFRHVDTIFRRVFAHEGAKEAR